MEPTVDGTDSRSIAITGERCDFDCPTWPLPAPAAAAGNAAGDAVVARFHVTC